MSLASQIRAAVSAAKAAVGDLLIDVDHEAYAGVNADGLKSYDAAVSRRAFVTAGTHALFRQTGVENVPQPTLLFLDNVPFDIRDRITLPDGSQPAIIEIDGITDPDGGTYYTQVKTGRPERGSVT